MKLPNSVRRCPEETCRTGHDRICLFAIGCPAISMPFQVRFGPDFTPGRLVRPEIDARERTVGPFRAGFPCENRESDTWILNENQLKRFDHTFPRQLPSCARGLGP